MSRRVWGTLQLFTVIGAAVTAAACSGPLPSDGTAVETRTSALSPPPPGPGPGPAPPAVSMFVDAPPTMNSGDPSQINVSLYASAFTTSDVTVTFNLTGDFTLGFANTFLLAPGGCMQDTSVPGAAIVTCHGDMVSSFASISLPLTPGADGTISVSTTLTVGGAPAGSDSRVIAVSTATTADLSIYGFSDGSVFVGNTAYGQFYVSNNGPLTATGVTQTFTLSGPGAFTSVGGGSSCSFTATTATCTGDTLPKFGFLPSFVSFTATGAGTIQITASVTANQDDPTPWNNTFTTFTTAVQPRYVDLSVAVTPGHQTVISKPLNYTLTVHNNGPDAAGDAVVFDTLPFGTTFVSATPSQGFCYGGQWGSLTCDLGTLAAGASANVALVVTPTVLAQVTNTATVNDFTFGDYETDYNNNYAFATVTVHGSTNQLVTGPPTKGGCGLWPGAPIDAMEDGDPTLRLGSKEIGAWFVASDGTGVQSPTSPDGLAVPGGPGSSKFMVRSTGSGFSIWGAALGIGFGCPYDVSRYHAVRFDVKAGARRTFFLEVPIAELRNIEFGGTCDTSTSVCQDYHRYQISLPDDSWYQCTVAYTDLRQAGWGTQAPFDVGAVMGAQFNMETWQTPYDLSIDNVEFVAPPKTQTSCVRIASK